MKKLIFTNWNFFRVMRFLMGIMIVVQAYTSKDWMFGIAGLLFSGMALFNTGCCSVQGCAMPEITKKASNDEIVFEEVKDK